MDTYRRKRSIASDDDEYYEDSTHVTHPIENEEMDDNIEEDESHDKDEYKQSVINRRQRSKNWTSNKDNTPTTHSEPVSKPNNASTLNNSSTLSPSSTLPLVIREMKKRKMTDFLFCKNQSSYIEHPLPYSYQYPSITVDRAIRTLPVQSTIVNTPQETISSPTNSPNVGTKSLSPINISSPAKTLFPMNSTPTTTPVPRSPSPKTPRAVQTIVPKKTEEHDDEADNHDHSSEGTNLTRIVEAIRGMGGKATGLQISNWIGKAYGEDITNKKRLSYTVNAVLSSKKHAPLFHKTLVVVDGNKRAMWSLTEEGALEYDERNKDEDEEFKETDREATEEPKEIDNEIPPKSNRRAAPKTSRSAKTPRRNRMEEDSFGGPGAALHSDDEAETDTGEDFHLGERDEIPETRILGTSVRSQTANVKRFDQPSSHLSGKDVPKSQKQPRRDKDLLTKTADLPFNRFNNIIVGHAVMNHDGPEEEAQDQTNGQAQECVRSLEKSHVVINHGKDKGDKIQSDSSEEDDENKTKQDSDESDRDEAGHEENSRERPYSSRRKHKIETIDDDFETEDNISTYNQMIDEALRALGGRTTGFNIINHIDENHSSELSTKSKSWKNSLIGCLTNNRRSLKGDSSTKRFMWKPEDTAAEKTEGSHKRRRINVDQNDRDSALSAEYVHFSSNKDAMDIDSEYQSPERQRKTSRPSSRDDHSKPRSRDSHADESSGNGINYVVLVEQSLRELGGTATGNEITEAIANQYQDLGQNKKKLSYTVNAILSSKKYSNIFVKDTVIANGRSLWKLTTSASKRGKNK